MTQNKEEKKVQPKKILPTYVEKSVLGPNRANVRKEPSLTAEVLKVIEPDTKLLIEENSAKNKFVKIKGEGFILESLLY